VKTVASNLLEGDGCDLMLRKDLLSSLENMRFVSCSWSYSFTQQMKSLLFIYFVWIKVFANKNQKQNQKATN